nr:unnamed protein product [Callosobruchus analis]
MCKNIPLVFAVIQKKKHLENVCLTEQVLCTLWNIGTFQLLMIDSVLLHIVDSVLLSIEVKI